MASPFIRAHGYVPGPTERPVSAGLLSAGAAAAPAVALAWAGGGLAQIAQHVGVDTIVVAAGYAAMFLIAGALYGRVFMRAANDRQAGWLFGISYGFVTWMAGPVSAVQWLTSAPAVVGVPAQLLA